MNWIRPTQHRDPQGEWAEQEYTDEYKPEYAYDSDLTTMAMARVWTPEKNLKEYGDYWSGWLEFYPERPVNCTHIRLNYHKSNHYGRTQIEVRRTGGVWVDIFCTLPRIHTPYWHEIDISGDGFGSLVYGIRIRFERPENLNGEQICFDVYGAEFYGELTGLPLIDPPADTVPVKGSVEITGVKWGFKPVPSRNATIWRTLEHLGSNQGVVPIMVTWKNLTDKPLKGIVQIDLENPSEIALPLKYLQGSGVVVYPNQVQAVTFELPVVNVSPSNQGDWALHIGIDAAQYDDEELWEFTVGTPYIEPDVGGYPYDDVAVWEISKGYTPHHLPDSFESKVDLMTLTPPPEVQGIYYLEDNESLFWAKDVPGTTLGYMYGGKYADYMVTATGDCTWEIPLGRRIPPTNDGEKQNLRNGLENGFLADNWWTYTDDERREMALQITQWFSVEEFGEPKRVAYSTSQWANTDPSNMPSPLPEDYFREFLPAHCGSESGLRYALIGGQHQPDDNLFYYTKQHGDYEWRKARQDKPFNLPVYVAFINWTENGVRKGHWACALQVTKPDRLHNNFLHCIDDFVYFQFGENDIKRGDAQMQRPGDTTINEIIGFGSYGHPKAGAQVGHWEY